ncbi:MAG: hypothetical protein ACREVH_01520 [Gammaproteobacteria bacterium]
MLIQILIVVLTAVIAMQVSARRVRAVARRSISLLARITEMVDKAIGFPGVFSTFTLAAGPSAILRCSL